MGIFDKLVSRRSRASTDPGDKRPSGLSRSVQNGEAQVMGFKKSIKGNGVEPNLTRELYSVPKPTEVETMVDHIQNHKSGDVFPYMSVYGIEDEVKDGRLSRLRAFRSAYGKETRPEMRINGIELNELEGTIKVQDLKDYVNNDQISKTAKRENKRFKPLREESFTKPYIQITRITGEYVPLMSSSSDYTELYFTLEDGRLLENSVIAQSVKLPSNQNGVFELSCDYCISTKDLTQLSLKYFLSRPIMKDGFQWGSVSLVIRISESETPFVAPKVEAMAVVRTPYTTLEEQSKDPDHADVVYTSAQIKKFREMYQAGDIADIDEAKKERMKQSSYSKSSIRGLGKSVAKEEVVPVREGWEHIRSMRKPLLPEGEASVSAVSEDEDDIEVNQLTRRQYEEQQEKMRNRLEKMGIKAAEEDIVKSKELVRAKPSIKKLRFEEEEREVPNTDAVFEFD
jgi:hypothetical protein